MHEIIKEQTHFKKLKSPSLNGNTTKSALYSGEFEYSPKYYIFKGLILVHIIGR